MLSVYEGIIYMVDRVIETEHPRDLTRSTLGNNIHETQSIENTVLA